MIPHQTITDTSDPAAYPGGEDGNLYRKVFDLWIILFLGVICLGFLNYLGIYAKTFQ